MGCENRRIPRWATTAEAPSSRNVMNSTTSAVLWLSAVGPRIQLSRVITRAVTSAPTTATKPITPRITQPIRQKRGRPPRRQQPGEGHGWLSGLHGANGAVEATAGSPATTAAGGGEAVPMRFSSVGWLGETVTDSEHRQHVFGPASLGLDLPPDVLDVGIDRPFVGLEGHALNRVEQLSACEDAAGLPRHRGQDLKLGLGEIRAATRDPHIHTRDVELHV